MKVINLKYFDVFKDSVNQLFDCVYNADMIKTNQCSRLSPLHISVICLVFLMSILNIVKGQQKGFKPPLDSTAFESWQKADRATISSDGKFVSYEIINRHFLNDSDKDIVIQSVNGDWKWTFHKALYPLSFLDEKRAITRLPGDTLVIIHLGTARMSYITGINSFLITPSYLIYQTKAFGDSLVIEELRSGKKRYVPKVLNYQYDAQKDILLLHSIGWNGNTNLSCYYLKDHSILDFWQGKEPGNFVFDQDSNQIGFAGIRSGRKLVWRYDVVERRCRFLFDADRICTDSLLADIDLQKFSQDGQFLFFSASSARKKTDQNQAGLATTLEVWKTSDAVLKPAENALEKVPNVFYYVLDLDRRSPVRLTYENEDFLVSGCEFAIIRHRSGIGSEEEIAWNKHSQQNLYRVWFKNGQRTSTPYNGEFSPSGKYFLYQNSETSGYFVENVSTKQITNVTKEVSPDGILHIQNDPDKVQKLVCEGVNWLSEERCFIFYSRRDLWLLDPEGIRPPVQLTNGYGTKNNILFSPLQDLTKLKLKVGSEIILAGFDYKNKKNGFYKVIYGKNADPQTLTLDANFYFTSLEYIENNKGRPVKAQKVNAWLVSRMNASESPNFFVTKDFKVFKKVSEIHPEKKFNWLTTSLHSWKSFSGDSLQGILYKPENFDPNKKYPIIFHQYMDFSRNLNAFLDPDPAIGPMNIPWFVSHGYLVFFPDIKYTVGKTGQSAYDAVVSAANYMKKMPFIDSLKMGLQGHSFGGYQTNYIICRTDMFAAANESSGISNITSTLGHLDWKNRSSHIMANTGQLGLGVSISDSPEVYIENSPIFRIKQLNTPLLMMATTNDRTVPFSQAIEQFTALREMKKKAWMLVYYGENHVLREKPNYLDYTARQMQFFDYFLKNKQEPDWMKPDKF